MLRIVVNYCKTNGGEGVAEYHRHTQYFGCEDRKTLVFAAAQDVPFGGDHRNMAYSSVITHEYGHYVLDKLIGEPGYAFGEGFADTYSIFVNNDEQIGRWHEASTPFIRHPIAAECVYEVQSTGCTFGDKWERGQVLGGIWTRILNGFIAANPTTGLAQARHLHANWALTTAGGDTNLLNQNDESAHPGTLIEVLMVDDDDGNLGNGTQNDALICNAFEQHGIDCP